MGGVVKLWTKYGIQILVLFSLLLQLVLFIIPIARRHKWLEKNGRLGRYIKLLVWLAYQLADTTAIFVLGHMAFVSTTSTSTEHRQLMALWAAILLVHLGGQDTITAYALEDNRLWKRHLLTLLVQVAGVIYVLPAHGGGNPRMSAAGALMFIVGFLKFVERVYVLRSSDMTKLANLYQLTIVDDYWRVEGLDTYTRPQEGWKLAEEDHNQAHDLLHFSIGQLVDVSRELPPYFKKVIKFYDDEKKLYELVELQLSLIHDKLYTKAGAIHTWHGYLIRAFSWLATVVTCTLLRSSTKNGGAYRYSGMDTAATYALLAGAFLLETASLLKAAGSTWTCQLLSSRNRDGLLLHIVISIRRLFKVAESSRRWPGYVVCCKRPELKIRRYGVWRSDSGTPQEITKDQKLLVVEQIRKMVNQFDDEEKMNNSRGGLSLQELSWPDDLKARFSTQFEFDETFLLWYKSTRLFSSTVRDRIDTRDDGTRREPAEVLRLHFLDRTVVLLSEYMMYLFFRRPHMLPPPVRHSLIPKIFPQRYEELEFYQELMKGELLTEEKLKAMLGVRVEMLCYAASYCSRESHVRELSNGSGEFATVVWLVRAALFNSKTTDAEHGAEN